MTPTWQTVPFHERDGQAALDAVDHRQGELDRKWGIGRLRLVVSQELREKIDRQQYKLDHAMEAGSIGDLKEECRRMLVGLDALDKAATHASIPELQPEVWEFVLKDGSVGALVRTNMDAARVVADGRQRNVYSLDEIAELIHGFPALVKLKHQFPGAVVTRAVSPFPKGGDNIDNVQWGAG